MFNNLLYTLVLAATLVLSGCGNNTQNEVNTTTKDSSAKELTRLTTLIRKYPNNAQNYYERSRLYMNRKDVDAAKKDIEKAVELDSTKAPYYLVLSDVHFVLNETRKSKEALEKCVTLDPSNTEALLKLAELYLYVSEYKTAFDYLDKALFVNKYNAKAYFIKGMVFKEMGDTNNALSSFQTTVEQDPDYYSAYVQLGNLQTGRKNPVALDYYNSALNLNPKSTEVYYNIGLFYQENNADEKAIQTYNSLLQIDSTYSAAYYNIGYIYLHNKEDVQKALLYFDKAVKANNSYAEAYYMRGLCKEALQKYPEAQRDYTEALYLKEDFELAFEGLKRLKEYR